MMDVGLHHGAIGAQLPTLCELQLGGDGRHSGIQQGQRLRLDALGPADQHCVIGHGLKVQAAEATQQQAIGHMLLGLFIAPIIQSPDHQHAQDHLHRRRRTPGAGRLWVTLSQIALDRLKDRVVLQEQIDLSQLRIHLAG